ncbi:MAG: heme o synthase [Actinomycetota bacterium]|nr:heme o synthase [Actinomycetota bacterium]
MPAYGQHVALSASSPKSTLPLLASSIRSRTSHAAEFVALTKPRIIELLLVTTLPAMVLARRGVPSGWLILFTLVGGTLAAGGANAANMVVDRDIDKLMSRTQRRPLVTGTITPRAGASFAVLLEVAAFIDLWLAVNLLSALIALLAALFYVFVYTIWLKRTSTQNIVIGGAAGAAPALIGWVAVTGRLSWAPVILFAIIFLWTPPHFWSLAVRYKDDYQTARVPMLPAVASIKNTSRQIIAYTAVMWAASLALVPVAGMGAIYLASAALLGGVFMGYALNLARSRSPESAMSLFRYSIIYLTLLFVAVALDVLVRHP